MRRMVSAEQQAGHADPGSSPSGGVVIPQRRRAVRLLFLVGSLAALTPLTRLNVAQPQPLLFFSWLAAMLLYLLQWPRPRGLLRRRPSRWLLIGLAVYVLILFAGFCRVYDNWRFAVTGDSLLFYAVGEQVVLGQVNPLNVTGVFEQCTIVQGALQNVFMLVSVSVFAHRLGNLLWHTLIVISAALFAAQTSSATAAVLLGVFLPANSVFQLFTLISYPNFSGVLPYYAAYALFLAAWRVWDSNFLWAALGLVCGLAVYFLPLWMGAVGVVSAGVVLSALYWKTPRIFLVWAGGVAIAFLPGLLQFSRLIHIWFVFRPTQGLSVEYFLRILKQTLSLPLASDQRGYGADGPWLRPPFGYLFLAGVVLAAVSGVLALLRRPRGSTLRHAWFWLLLFVGDAVGLSLQNSGYGTISVKRAIVLLPAMMFLTVLPLAWIAERVGRTWFTVVLTLVTLCPYGYLNATTLWNLPYGFNTGDGMVEMVQTAPLPILLVTRDKGLRAQFGTGRVPHDPMQEMFHVRDHTLVTDAIPQKRSDFQRTVCTSRHTDGQEWGEQVRQVLATLCPGKRFQQVTAQLECVICDPP